MKIISGGQNGVDIAALKAAKKLNLETGGFIPAGFMTVDGKKPELKNYGLIEIPFMKNIGVAYITRSKKNIDFADVVIAFRFINNSSSGTDKSINYAINEKWDSFMLQLKKPYMIFDEGYRPILIISELNEESTTGIRSFLTKYQPKVINVLGSRESEYEKAVEEFLVNSLA